ncbi:MAG: hypothetical protein WDM78_01555 [Puia sp.]
MQACEHLNEKSFRKSTEHYISLFPEEPTPYLLMMKEFVNTKSYGDYGRAIDKLDTLLHIDPFLNYFRGKCSNETARFTGSFAFLSGSV